MRLLLVVGLVVSVTFALLLYHNYKKTRTHVLRSVNSQAEMALSFDIAIGKYVAERIRPAMYDLTGEDDFFSPETMSTSFVAREVFEEVRKQFPSYVLDFSSDNPRNPMNKATEEESKILEYFNDHSEAKDWTGMIKLQGQPYVARFHARRMQVNCLSCHGDPADAPQSII